MPAELPLHDVSGHLVTEIGARRVLIDTGSPFTFGRGGELEVGGRTVGVGEGIPEVDIGIIHEHVDPSIDVVLGTDVLRTLPVLLDLPGGAARIGGEPELDGARVETQLRMGVPVVPLLYGRRTVPAVLDTGAPVSYMDPTIPGRREPDGEAEDFYPLVGTFTTKLYRASVSCGGRTVDTEFGVLPPMLSSAMGLLGARWILGTAFFRAGPVLLELGKGAITVSP